MIMPAGYMTLVDSAYSLLKFWSDDTFGTDTRKIEDAIKEITALLGGEVIKSVGWDSITGELIPIPAAVFRKINGIDIVGERKVILISSSDDKNQIAVIPIIDAYELIGTFKCLMPTIINFDPSEWNFTAQSVSPALDIKNNDSMEYVSFKKAGRPRKHDWDKFFHEVALQADKDGISQDGHPDNFRKHMFDWAASNMKPNPPDNSQIKKKLKPIEEKWRERNLS